MEHINHISMDNVTAICGKTLNYTMTGGELARNGFVVHHARTIYSVSCAECRDIAATVVNSEHVVIMPKDDYVKLQNELKMKTAVLDMYLTTFKKISDIIEDTTK